MKTNALLIALFVLAGCADELPPGSLIERTRLLGARVEVDGEPNRAWPRPGETVSIRWVVAQPDAPAPLAWSFALVGEDGEAFALMSGAGEAPVLSLVVPSREAMGDTSELFLVGVVCANGTPVVEGGETSCAGEAAEKTDVALTLRLASDEAINYSPVLNADAISLNGQMWPAVAKEPALEGCATAEGVPLVHVDDAVDIVVATQPADRETFLAEAPGGGMETRREPLHISSFATDGELDRQFSVIEGEDAPSPHVELEWIPPAREDVPEGGLRVRFTIVVRDGRGGLDAATRVACVIP